MTRGFALIALVTMVVLSVALFVTTGRSRVFVGALIVGWLLTVGLFAYWLTTWDL